jgi:serine/threonine protein kinase/tetratricopeptide (TPR) repeat protein
MTLPQLQIIKEIFQGALDCEPDRVSAFLETACQGDKILRHEVEALLTAHQQAGNFIEAPIAGLAANIIQKGQTGLLIGRTIGHYKISKRIDAGGMGEVYLASDITAGRKAAIKLLPAHLTGDAERLMRFQQEARVIARLNHPNIVTIYEVGADNSTRYIASELIEGETLRQRLARGRMQVGEVIEISIQVAAALAAAHSAGVVHRDVKPENIMLRPDGYVKILDFGIAKLAEQELPETMAQEEAVKLVETNVGSILGTVSYMSPEQARGAPTDKRTDIWSLGVVLYEMAVGRAPFTGDTSREVMDTILAKEPLPISHYIVQAPDDLQQIITKAVRKNPDERFRNASEMLHALKGLRRKLEFIVEMERSAAKRRRWTGSPMIMALVLVVGLLALVFRSYWPRNSTTSSTSEKSVAVLPFENLSNDREDTFFADGVQDDLLTKLAKIADLKVISRTSVMGYRGKQNTREIGDALRVSHVLEGSVRKTGAWLHINAQLIDTRTDSHVWAEQYDRDLKDMFAVQSEIAQKVVERLHAKISATEKLAIERPPTVDFTAFEVYSRAKSLFPTASFTRSGKASLLKAVDLLNQAAAHDPTFFKAYCQLAWTHDQFYILNLDHTPERLALAEAAIDTAFRLRPDAGEAHLARAENLYQGYLDYDGALAELETARQTLPNDSRIFELKGYIERREGHWEESTRNLERAVDLDPRNIFLLEQVALSYDDLRRYADEEAMLDRMLAIEPNNIEAKTSRAEAEFDWKADTRPLHQWIDSVRATNPLAIADIADSWLFCALAERDHDAAASALAELGENGFGNATTKYSLRFGEGLIARMTKDDAKARAAFIAARAEQEKLVRARPDNPGALCVLGLIDAALGRNEEALREGQRAVELLPVEKDAINGMRMIVGLARIAAWVDEKDLACKQLARASRLPGPKVSYGELKLLPWWDPLRGDPRFEKIVASLAPKKN